MKKIANTLLLLTTITITLSSCRETRFSADTEWNRAKAEKWVKDNVWRQGFMVALHPSTNVVEFARQYHKNPALWKAAFQFMANKKLDTLTPGRHVIAGDVLFANVTESATKNREEAQWEGHKNYIDLQYVVKGREMIGVAPSHTASMISGYDENKDLMNFTTEGVYHLAEPGVFFLFFPGDAHRPGIKVEGYDVVKKVELKVRVQE